jgi:hypothetical protein
MPGAVLFATEEDGGSANGTLGHGGILLIGKVA